LKPYGFIEDKTLQLVLIKLNDLVSNELVQTRKFDSIRVELEGFQPLEFERVCKKLTACNIKGTYVPIHHYHNVHVHDNDVTTSNDQNKMFRKILINAYLLGVSKPKACVHSQP
jgi:hypothetical protein